MKKMKKISVCVAALTALATVSSTVTFAAGDYPNKELWDVVSDNMVEWEGREEAVSIREYLAFGSDGFDIDAYVDSSLGENLIQNWTLYANYSDPMDEAVVAYWKEHGVTKEMHDADDKEKMWASYVPDNLAEGEKLPVVFVFHGNTNSIWVAETFGFAQYGAEDGKYITIIPEAANGDASVEEFDRILTYLVENGYPVDESRVYCCGFSKGSFEIQNVANAYPTKIAGIASGGNIAHTPNGWTPGDWIIFTEEQMEELSKTKMPFMDYSGTFDSDNYPLSVSSHMDDPEEKVAGYNMWLKATGAVGEELTVEAAEDLAANSEDEVKRRIGIDFTETEIRELEDTTYYIGTLQNEDDVTVYEWVNIEGQQHWPAPSIPKLCWEFLSKFSRDLEIGELIAE